jgi:hypothetical protein
MAGTVEFRRFSWLLAVIAVSLVAGIAACKKPPPRPPRDLEAAREEMTRQNLFAELRPVTLANCALERFGEQNDGGYLLCANLLGSAAAGYSYGISGYDGWGCDVSRRLNVSLHQYDCFDLRVPSCPAGHTLFHPECVAGAPFTDGGRPFDTVEHQLARNGDGARHVVMKMDVEGAEWDSLWNTPDGVLQRIDQLDIEFHHNQEERFVAIVQRLKIFFYVAHVHFNNFSCDTSVKPFPSWAYEVLFVSKKLGTPDPSGAAPGLLPLDAPNDPKHADCQAGS